MLSNTQISDATGKVDAGLQALLAAVHADDPKREILVRVGDLMRDLKSLQAALAGHVVEQDAPATAVYGNLIWRHAAAARKDFDGPDRKRIYSLIEELRVEYPSECAVWDARYSTESAAPAQRETPPSKDAGDE